MVAITTVPWIGPVLAVTVSPVPMSLDRTLAPRSGVLACVAPMSPMAVGFTARETVAVETCPAASVVV